jgi:hypothetical protein
MSFVSAGNFVIAERKHIEGRSAKSVCPPIQNFAKCFFNCPVETVKVHGIPVGNFRINSGSRPTFSGFCGTRALSIPQRETDGANMLTHGVTLQTPQSFIFREIA